MKILLTDAVSKKKLVVDSDLVRLMYPNDDGSTHVVFDDNQGRQVVESLDSILAVVPALIPPKN